LRLAMSIHTVTGDREAIFDKFVHWNEGRRP
jgi:hypothetical protein